ncbi:hypothetical protein PGT21_009512 [Puccinia graminis f. sp. tritici]|uniref:Alpha/beta hydrolase fold-3 domain-containing protein n=1 Tax=Puccinia graminis f. sp. tritici TaxID=56615 RepID=A0A5B0R030_PUCGR|nr:hypothetical protein PGT21_009512 [Puccinia graminis f. sp. tritici]
MIDHLLGRPSPSWRRTQVILVLLFWAWRLRSGDPGGPAGVKQLNNRFKKFSPWQISVTLLTCLYGIRHWDTLVGLAAPEPLARLYSRGFYRATWINTALDAGFATAAPIPVKWLRDLLSVLFSGYYLIYANEADEKLRRYRAVPTVEVLRITWEKTTNPIIEFFTRSHRPSIPIKRKFIFPRPSGSKYTKPITCWLYSSRPDLELVRTKNLILDVPGGGFIAMSPFHHEERIIQWTIKTGIPILSIDYCKAPEYPFPYAIHECMDVYRIIQESKGRVIGMGRDIVDIVLTGDSAGANLSAAMIISILESSPDSPFHSLPLPVGILWLYAALDFNFTSWMSPENLRILRRGNSSSNLPEGILEAKSHLNHKSPLSVVDDRVHHDGELTSRGMKKKFRKSIANLPSMVATWKRALTPKVERSLSDVELKLTAAEASDAFDGNPSRSTALGEELNYSSPSGDNEKSLGERVLFHEEEFSKFEASVDAEQQTLELTDRNEAALPLPQTRAQRKAFGTHLTMTSRTGFFNDRIISPSMMRCMAICYVGPRNAPDLTKDHHISPIFTPSSILARFPPVYLLCGEKDPFVDDTVIIAGKIREAKQQRKREALVKLHRGNVDPDCTPPMKLDPILDEEESDWVQMRIFEGWSHGFAQMLSLLPEVSTAFDLTADFMLSAFQKHDARMQAKPTSLQVPSTSIAAPVPKPHLKPSFDSNDDEALTFTPRLRARAESSSRSASPSPRLLNNRPTRSSSGLGSGLSSSPTQRPLLPALRISQGQSQSSTEINLVTPTSAKSPARIERIATPKALVDFNVASAAAIVTPPILPATPTAILSGRKEGNVLDDHHDLLHRRREEAGYGLPPMKTPEDHFKPLELSNNYSPSEGRLNENEAEGQYVGEKDLLERRLIDAAYGITQSTSQSNPSGSVKSDH